MSTDLTQFSFGLPAQQAAANLLKCNDVSSRFGLALTEGEALALVAAGGKALAATGRIEFGPGIADKIITAFCDSPYLSPHNYADILCELTELFYTYKNETMDRASDDELIDFMKTQFDGVCHGSLELLEGRALYGYAKALRLGLDPEDTINEDTGQQDGEGDDDE